MKEEGAENINWGDEKDLAAIVSQMKVDPKVAGRNNLAYAIVGVIGLALMVILACGAVVVIIRPPAESERIITKCMIPFLQGVAGFWSTIFGPPLWMILGYFFASERRTITPHQTVGRKFLSS